MVVQETLLGILNSHTHCVYLCHSQMTEMATMALFAEMLEWQWHYSPALDSLYLTAPSHVCLYILFQHPFTVLVFSRAFDPVAPYDEIPLHMAHLTMAPPQPSPSMSMETDPSEASTSPSSASTFGDSKPLCDDPGAPSIMVNDFLTPEQDQGQDLLGDCYFMHKVAFFRRFLCEFGPWTQLQFLLPSCIPTGSCPYVDIF